jgi:pimeloyl-ACP methyl ester carboxylesterase
MVLGRTPLPAAVLALLLLAAPAAAHKGEKHGAEPVATAPAELQGSAPPAGVDLRQLRGPLLLLSADDDRFGTAATARAIARQVPGSRLIIYRTGGHIFLGHQRDSAAEIARFVREHSKGRM